MLPACHLLSRHLDYQINSRGTAVLKFKSPLFYSKMSPKQRSSNAGNFNMPKKNRKVLPLSKKVKVLDSIGKKINFMLRLLRTMVKNKSCNHKIVKNKELCASFAVPP